MSLMVRVISIFLVSMAPAHALEFPGKVRLNKETYVAVQRTYYRGFTIGRALDEGLGMVATLILLIMTPAGSAAFWWALCGFVALVAMHGAYWIVTHR